MRAAQRFRIWRNRFRAIVRKEQLDEDLDREFHFHYEQLVAEHVADGMTPEDARLAARRALGNVSSLAEECRDERRVSWLHDAKQDFGYGWRMLLGNRRFAIVAAASLALGIGANTAILSALNSVFRLDLPLPSAERLVQLRGYTSRDTSQFANATVPEYLAWQERTHSYSSMGLSIANFQDLSATDDGAPPERIVGQAVTLSLLQAIAVKPQLGRLFSEEEARIERPSPVVILGHRLWQRRFHGDSTIVGRQIRMDGRWTTVVGVMPEGLWYPHPAVDYWIPLGVNPPQRQGSGRLFAVTARLRPGVTEEQANAELAGISAQLRREFPEREGGWTFRTVSLREIWFRWLRQPLLMLESAGLLILLIACANVATLLVARATVRQPEFAMRAALGAGHGRIIRQLLAESVLLSAIGGAMGLAVAWMVLRILNGMQPPPGGIPVPVLHMDGTSLLLAAGIATVCGLTFGILPALTGLAGAKSLHEQSKRQGRDGVRGTLVSVQVGLALMLLIGSGLLVQSIQRLVNEDRGFDPQGLLTFDFRIPPNQYMKSAGLFHGMPSGEAKPATFELQRVFERIRTLPGVQSAGGISQPVVNAILLPALTVMPEGRPVPQTGGERASLEALYFLITPNLFPTLRAKIVRGRDIGPEDTAASTWVAVINETAARHYWPGDEPIGKRFTLDAASGEQPRTVVGVVHDVATPVTEAARRPAVYTSYLQQPKVYRGFNANMFGQMTFALRGAGDLEGLEPALRQAVSEVDPDHPIYNVTPIVWWGGFVTINRSLYLLVLGTFATVATLLAAMGIFGVTAYAVSRRTREIAIRMSLGAQAHEIRSLLCSKAILLIAAGVAAGLVGAWMFSSLLRAQLWRIAPDDPATFIAAAVFLSAVGLAATLIPVRKATTVNPAIALRRE